MYIIILKFKFLTQFCEKPWRKRKIGERERERERIEMM
jgi:hypothetical protein